MSVLFKKNFVVIVFSRVNRLKCIYVDPVSLQYMHVIKLLIDVKIFCNIFRACPISNKSVLFYFVSLNSHS